MASTYASCRKIQLQFYQFPCLPDKVQTPDRVAILQQEKIFPSKVPTVSFF